MIHASLFSGIGGFDLAAEWMGWQNLFHCECNTFAQKILKYHFPNTISYNDITKTNFTIHTGTVDILTGGFPCQPFSFAGKRKGKNDERYLWNEMYRAIQEIEPKYIIAENVYGITNIDGGLVFEQVCIDLENAGYEVQPFIIPAVAKNAPHRRDRCWFIANTINSRNLGRSGKIQVENEKQKVQKWHNIQQFEQSTNIRQKVESFGNWKNFPSKPAFCLRDDGISGKLDNITFSKWRKESIRAYGNAIVPQIAFEIFKVINEMEKKSGNFLPL